MTAEKYTKTAIVLHWLIALMILGMFLLGWYMSDLPKEAAKVDQFDFMDLGIYTVHLTEAVSPRTFYFNLHKSLGITLLALVILRILWRVTHRPPTYPESLKAWEKKLSTATHHTLYLLMVAMPLSGVIMSTYSKFGLKWFGLDVLSGVDNKPMRENFAEIHEFIATVILLVVFIHIAGALKHKLIDKDQTHKRMSLR